jgi:MFS family permease
VVTVSHPGTFTAVYLADAVSFLAFVPVLLSLRVPEQRETGSPAPQPDPHTQSQAQPQSQPQSVGFREVLRDKAFMRVWALTALIVAVSFGQFQSSFPGYTTRPGGISTHGLGLAFAADTLVVVGLQLVVLRWLTGHKRTTAVALAALGWAASWAVVIAGGHLGSGAAAEAAFVMAMVIFAIAETLFAPTMPAIINDIAPPEAAGRYNGVGVLAYTTGFLLGPVLGSAALGAWGAGLFMALIAACLIAAVAALRLSRALPPGVNLIAGPADADADAEPDTDFLRVT